VAFTCSPKVDAACVLNLMDDFELRLKRFIMVKPRADSGPIALFEPDRTKLFQAALVI